MGLRRRDRVDRSTPDSSVRKSWRIHREFVYRGSGRQVSLDEDSRRCSSVNGIAAGNTERQAEPPVPPCRLLALCRHFTEHPSSLFKASHRERPAGILGEAIALANELHGFLDLIDKSACGLRFAIWCPRDLHINGAGMCKDRAA